MRDERRHLAIEANSRSGAEARRYDAMASDHAAHNVPMSALNAKPVTSLAEERSQGDTPSRWRSEYAAWSRRFES